MAILAVTASVRSRQNSFTRSLYRPPKSSVTVTLVVGATPNPYFRRVEARVGSADGRPLLSLTTVMGAN